MAKVQSIKKSDPELEKIIITPAMASSWLEASKFDNRRIDDRNVEKMARDIKSGKWIFDGNPIRFDKEGNILDGQHRLWAIVTAGKDVESSVVRGLDASATTVIDSGKSRSIHDFLHFNGYSNNTALASATRIWVGYRTNGKDLRAWVSGNSSKRLSVNEILKEIKITPGLEDAVYKTQSNTYARKMVGVGTAAFCYYILAKVDPIAADEYFYLIDSGANMHDGNPILALRNWLMVKDYKGKTSGNVQLMIKVAVIIKAWNAWRKNRQIHRLMYSFEKESYPIPE